MTVNHTIRQAVRRALAVGALAVFGAGGLASAKPAPKPKPQPQAVPAPAASPHSAAPQLQTIVVTGTMIPRTEAETAQAITILKTSSLKNMGIVNVEQALGTVTSNNPTINIASAVGTFSGGGTYANLRGLGQGRTLVLLDGHRLANNAFTGDSVDLSGIPFSAIQSVQVLREGASALYGSDAIAGVINFITKRNYQGAEIEATLDHPQEAGGGSGDIDFTFGHGDLVRDGYNFMITGSYTEQQALTAAQRSFSAEGFYPALGSAATNNPGTWPATVITNYGSPNQMDWQPGYPACTGNPELTTYFGNCAYRYSAATDLIPKSYEASALMSFTKTLPANNTVRLQYFYTRSKVTAWSGPMFYFFEMTPQADPTYYPSAAGLTCESYYTTCSGAPALGGPIIATWTDPNNNRYNDSINTEQRALLTFSGDNDGWNYTLNLNWSQNLNTDGNVAGYPNEAVLAPTSDPVTGVPIISNLINPFGPQTVAGQALINSSYINGVYEAGKMKRWSVSGHASHRLGDAFHAGHDAVLAVGFNVHGDSFQSATTPYNNLVSAATGLSSSAVQGSRTAQAVFVELNVPMSKQLDVDISDREDRYSDFGKTNNGKLTVRYQPSRYVTFRGAASTGFRAPTLYDLYQPNFMAASTSGNMGNGNPFCTPGNYNGEWSQSTCNTQGLGLFGGNRRLTPEKSENFDLGVIVEPVRNLGITLDYYRILLKNTIGSIPASAIYGNPNGFTSSIVTNDSGTLTPSIAEGTYCTPYTQLTCGYIVLTDQNTGHITTDGFDVSVKYMQQTRFGVFREDLEGTAVTQFRLQEYNGGPTLNLVGWYQGGNLYQPAMRWEHMLRLDWSSPQGKWGAGLSNRFYSSYIDEFGVGPTNSGPQRKVGSLSTWDAYTSYKPVQGLTVLFGIRNLFNTSPPFTNASQNNFAAGYDALFANPILRDFYLNLTYRFL
jgi:iron complex outermembrane receptor protein